MLTQCCVMGKKGVVYGSVPEGTPSEERQGRCPVGQPGPPTSYQ